LFPILPAIFKGSIPKVYDQVTGLNFGMETAWQSGKCLEALSSDLTPKCINLLLSMYKAVSSAAANILVDRRFLWGKITVISPPFHKNFLVANSVLLLYKQVNI